MVRLKTNYMKTFHKGLMALGVTLFLISCGNKESSDILVIPLDSDKEVLLPLSEIAEEVKAIDLELTDESLLTSSRIQRILLCDGNIIVQDRQTIMLFNNEGKFIRTIGSRGQGPGEYNNMGGIAVDEQKKHLIIPGGNGRLLRYDLEGNFIASSSDPLFQQVRYINSAGNELIALSSSVQLAPTGNHIRAVYYPVDKETLQIKDSVEVRSSEFKSMVAWGHEDFISYDGKNTYLFYPEHDNPLLGDTLYRIENRGLIPTLKIQVKNNELDANGSKSIVLLNIHKSSRYIFSVYLKKGADGLSIFCYDTKTRKEYNTKGGFTDDVYNSGQAIIRPLGTDPEKFYFLNEKIDDTTIEAPNPTLYIGTLKK